MSRYCHQKVKSEVASAPSKVFPSLLQSEASDILIKGISFGVCQIQSCKNLLCDGSFRI